MDYANDLALEIESVGGKPLVTLTTDKMFWDLLTKVPEKYLEGGSKALLSAFDHTDAHINLSGPEDPADFLKVPPGRLAAWQRRDDLLNKKLRERKIRTIALPFGEITIQRARNYGFDLPRWRNMITEAISVDYDTMSKTGRELVTNLEGANTVHLTAPNGTDLRLSIAERSFHVHDGVIDRADISQGSFSETLPSGYVTIAPIETSARGKVVFDQPRAIRGKMLRGLTWHFRDGRLTSSEATANGEAFTELLADSKGDKDRIGSFTLGINPNADFIGYSSDEIVLGAVSLGVGSNKDIGGLNDTVFYHSQTLSKATVDVDGKKVVIDGQYNSRPS
jgi:leucyl aminopeptidase (aminopeptidase T)